MSSNLPVARSISLCLLFAGLFLASPVMANEVPAPWTGELALGYSQASGNTESKQLDGRFLANRKTDADEWTFKADALYGSQNKKMNAQKYYGMGRYAYNFGEQKKWYHFFKQEADHDRFADIDYRLTPSTGVGYWFSDRPDWKLQLECGIGLEHTNFRASQESTTEPIATPRLYVMKEFANKFKISEELNGYPSLRDVGEYRLRSETIAEYPFGEKIAGRLSLIDEYNSDPATGREKNDVRLVSSLVYKF